MPADQFDFGVLRNMSEQNAFIAQSEQARKEAATAKLPPGTEKVAPAISSEATQGAVAGSMAMLKVKPGYQELMRVLMLALEQAQAGKGNDRHGTLQGKTYAFTDQPILSIGRMAGPGFNIGQAMKKAHESMELPPDRGRDEVLGAIVYLAGAYLLMEQK